MTTNTASRNTWVRSPLFKLAGVCVVVAGVFASQHAARSAEDATTVPAPQQDETAAPTQHAETAIFAGGCFWGVQGVFQHVRGVKEVVSGYTGGSAQTAQYETVSGGDTGHAESVQITYDPTQITYGRLLQVFFSVVHDPTELNRQGPDHGTQYRSAIVPMNDVQRSVAQAYIAQLGAAHTFPEAIVTRVESYKGFYPAEAYHQNFLTLHPSYPYIVVNDMPKVQQLKQRFPAIYRNEPVLLKTSAS